MTIISHLLIFIYTNNRVPDFGQVQERIIIFINTLNDEVPDSTCSRQVHGSMVGATILPFPV